MPTTPPPTLAEFRKSHPKLDTVHPDKKAPLSRLDRIAVFITDKVGTMGFFFIIVIWSAFWLGWNFLAPKELQFDPPMAFVFWLFISNLIQIMLMPLIMVGQNFQGRHSDIRAEHDLHVNIKAESEIEIILKHLEYQNSVLMELMEKISAEKK